MILFTHVPRVWCVSCVLECGEGEPFTWDKICPPNNLKARKVWLTVTLSKEAIKSGVAQCYQELSYRVTRSVCLFVCLLVCLFFCFHFSLPSPLGGHSHSLENVTSSNLFQFKRRGYKRHVCSSLRPHDAVLVCFLAPEALVQLRASGYFVLKDRSKGRNMVCLALGQGNARRCSGVHVLRFRSNHLLPKSI